jgi:hypothetical protein
MRAEYADRGLDPALDKALKAFMSSRKPELSDAIEED